MSAANKHKLDERNHVEKPLVLEENLDLIFIL
jgi:hypothetical protein